MNTAIAYDYIKRLENVGFSHAQAEVLMALSTEIPDQVATKQELVQLDQDLTHKFEKSESKLVGLIKDLKMELMKEFHAIHTEIHKLGSEIVSIKSDMRLLKGIGAFIVAFITLLAGFSGAFDFLKHFHF
jgi:hypothetical protein